MNTRHAHDTHSHTTSPLRAPSRGVPIPTPEGAPLSSEFFLLADAVPLLTTSFYSRNFNLRTGVALTPPSSGRQIRARLRPGARAPVFRRGPAR